MGDKVGDLSEPMLKRLRARIDDAIRRQDPLTRDLYRDCADTVGWLADGSTVYVTIDVGNGEYRALCEVTYADLRGETLN